jgi:hypothetical protein
VADSLFSCHLRKLRDALERYEDDPNFATEGALATACGAIWGDEWAKNQLDTNPAWDMDSPGGRRSERAR